jgi:hypothetical protein
MRSYSVVYRESDSPPQPSAGPNRAIPISPTPETLSATLRLLFCIYHRLWEVCIHPLQSTIRFVQLHTGRILFYPPP